MARVVFAIPGDIAAKTGGYGYDRQVIVSLQEFGFEVIHLALQGGFPDPTPADISSAVAAMQAAARPGDILLIDGLAYGALPAEAIVALPGHIVALCHHPLCLETGLTDARQKQLYASERAALALAAQVIATSVATGDLLVKEFSVDRRKLTIAAPGTDPAPRAKQGSFGPVALLAVGSVIPRKAFDMLIEALAGLLGLDWRLKLVGGLHHSPATVAALKAQIAACGLGQNIELCGEMFGADLDAAFATSDVFVSSSLYEGYGMALAEALARGLPIVTTTGGAAAQTVPDEAALKVQPGDAAALREALRHALSNAPLRKNLSDASWRAGQDLPRWRDTAQKIAGTLSRI